MTTEFNRHSQINISFFMYVSEWEILISSECMFSCMLVQATRLYCSVLSQVLFLNKNQILVLETIFSYHTNRLLYLISK